MSVNNDQDMPADEQITVLRLLCIRLYKHLLSAGEEPGLNSTELGALIGASSETVQKYASDALSDESR
jgi:hypothetical protein